MKVTRKNLIQSLLFLIVVTFLLVISMSDLNLTHSKMLITVGFIFISLVSLSNIIADARILSINKFHWYFQLVFMGLAPMCQYISMYFPWGVSISNADIISAQGLVLIFDYIYIIFYRKKKQFRTDLNISLRIEKYLTVQRDFSSNIAMICIIIGFCGFLLLVSMIGFYDLFFRSENNLDIENSTINFLVRKFLTSLPAMLCAVMILIEKNKRTLINKISIGALALFTICANFPTSTTRYWMGTIYLGIIILLYYKRRESRLTDYAILLALLVGFPLLYSFKSSTVDITTIMRTGLAYNGIIESFNTVDFDAFTLVARAVRYVRENGITYGQQLLNIILFFIPRSIWSSKPITTNVLIAESVGQTFTNLSSPLPAEGYVNFGIVGVILYALVYSRFCEWVDNLYWNISRDGEISILNMGYPFLCVIIIYIERGPLQPAFIQTIALLVPLMIINWISHKAEK